MLCGALSGGTPFVARTETLKKIPLDKSLEETEAIFISWFLRVKSLGLDLLLCPDMMHLVNSGGKWPPEISKETWRRILSKHGLQAVSTGKRGRPSVQYSFPCKEVKGSKNLFMAVSHKNSNTNQVGLSCDVRGLQSSAHLLPWCCLASYVHILASLEHAAQVTFHCLASAINFAKITYRIKIEM